MFFLEQFKHIFDTFINHFQENPKEAFGKDEKLNAILCFSLAVANEIKLDSINASNYQEISPTYLSNIRSDAVKSFNRLALEVDESREPSIYEKFLQKYYPSTKQYCFFLSIIEYFLGISNLCISSVIEDLNKYFPQFICDPPEHNQILIQLAYFECLNLKPLEYKRLTKKMLQFSDEGKYELHQYLTVFLYTIRFNNLLNYNIDNLKQRIKRGVKKSCETLKYTPNIQFYLGINSETEFNDQMHEIANFCIMENESLKHKEQRTIQDEHYNRFLTDFESFEDYSKRDILELRFEPFWINYKPKEVYKRILTLTSKQIWMLGFYFQNRYRKYIYEKLSPEKKFVEGLLTLVDNGVESKMRKTLKNASLSFLLKCLQEAQINFPENT